MVGPAPVSNNPSTPASDPNSLASKLKLLINNVGAPKMVQETLIKEIDANGPTPTVIDKIIQALRTEADIMKLTIDSVTNLKAQISGQPATATSQVDDEKLPETLPVTPMPSSQVTPPPVNPVLSAEPPSVAPAVPPTPASVFVPAPAVPVPQANPATATDGTAQKAKDQAELDKLLKELEALQTASKQAPAAATTPNA